MLLLGKTINSGMQDGLEWVFPVTLAAGVLVYVAAPFVGYAWVLSGDTTSIPDEESCVRSGTVLGAHWFEFESLPGSRCWTRDPVRAAEVRGRSSSLRLRPGLTPTLVPVPNTRATQHLLAGTTTATMVFAGMVCGYLWGGLIAKVLSFLQGEPLLSALGTLMIGYALGLVVFLPVLLATATALSTVLSFGWLWWTFVVTPRQASRIELGPSQLRDDGRTIDLDDPDLSVELSYVASGARLAVQNPRQALVLFGDHADLAPLAELLVRRERSAPDDRERIHRALQNLRDA